MIRRACLIAATAFVGLHLLLWLSVVPGAIARPALPHGEPTTVAVVALVLGLLLFGIAGVWLPLRALARPGPWVALGCALVAAAYAAMFWAAWWPGVGGPGWDRAALRALAEPGSLLVAAAVLATFLTFGLVQEPGWVGGAYVALLLLGAALSARPAAARGRAAPAPRAPTG